MDKQVIVAQLRAYVEKKGSQRKASNSLVGISSATINKLLNGTELDTISEEMWRNVAAQVGASEEEWVVAETQAHHDMTTFLHLAQRDALVGAVVGDAGTGKTAAISDYADKGRNVFHLVVSESWNKKTFMAKLIKSMGGSANGNNVNELMDEVVETLGKKEHPLLVLDEADKMSDSLMYFFITLYNELEGRCGIVMSATSYLEKRIRRGLSNKRKGYEEIFSRIGRKFFYLAAVSDVDVMKVCAKNGIQDGRIIRRICSECEGDMRRVRRSIWAAKQKTA